MENKKKNKKIILLFFILTKVLISLSLTVILPIIVFFLFISIKPQEISAINEYIKTEAVKNNYIDDFSFDSGKLFLDKHFNIGYKVQNLKINISKDKLVILPDISIKVNIFDIIRNNRYINEIELNKLYYEFEKSDNNTEIETEKDYLQTVKNIINYIYKNNVAINLITVNNSKILLEKNIIFVNKTIFNLREYSAKQKKMAIKMDIKTSEKGNNFIINSNCNINEDEKIDCVFDINNLSSQDFVDISKTYDIFTNYIPNIDSKFSLTGKIKLNNYTELEKLTFDFKSQYGNLLLKDFFNGTLSYKNLNINGEISDNFKTVNHLDLQTELVFEKNIENMLLKLNLKHIDNNTKLNIYTKKIPVNKLDLLWPVFLDDNGIKQWVVEHINNGYSPDAFVEMEFENKNNDSQLISLKSEVEVKDVDINYADFLPSITNAEGKLYFSQDDMKIKLDKANLFNTNLSNIVLFLDFNDEENNLKISGNGNGSLYELLYFIDNDSREQIKTSTEMIANGNVISSFNVVVPIINDLDFKDVAFSVKVNSRNNNTYFLKNNSSFDAFVDKPKNLNLIKINTDFKQAEIFLPFITFLKEKDQNQSLFLSLDTTSKDVIIQDIKAKSDDFLTFNGDGKINTDLKILEKLNLNDISYDKTKFNVIYNYNKGINLSIFVDEIMLDDDLKQTFTDFQKNFLTDKNTIDLKYNIKFASNIINYKSAIFRDINFDFSNNEAFYTSLKVKYDLNDNLAFTCEENKDKKTIIKANITNLSKFLRLLEIDNDIVDGNFSLNGTYSNTVFRGNITSNSKFAIKYKEKETDIDNYLKTNEMYSTIKEKIKSEKLIKFVGCDVNVKYYKNILTLKDFVLYGSWKGLDINGSGKINIKTGATNINGFIIPSGTLNRLIIVDKIPIVNDLILGGKNSGLFSIKYSITRENFDSELNVDVDKKSFIQFGILKKI